MSKIVTYRGQLPIGVEEKIHLSTKDGLTGYKLKKFEIMSSTPGVSATAKELIGKVRLTTDPNVGPAVDFSDPDLLAAIFLKYSGNTNPISQQIILDQETFNQDIFVYISSSDGTTIPCNFYIELEQFKIDLNTSTYHTLKNIRSRTDFTI